jgi:hypothetical protein
MVCDKPLKLQVVKCPGDGSCMFWSIGYHVNEDAPRVREKIVNEMTVNSKQYKPFISGSYNEYLRYMSMPRTWGDEPELAAASQVYRRAVEVYDTRHNLIERYGERYGNPIRVQYNGSSHYDSLKII